MQLISYDQVKSKIIEIRNQNVILDSDVAELYGVETKDINKAVKNNPDKFPQGYIFVLSSNEKFELVENFHRFNMLKHSTVLPKAFAERGLYMIATILKSQQAVETTIAIIDTFAKIKELTQNVYEFARSKTDEQKAIIFDNSSELVADLLGNELIVSSKETTINIKLPFFELTHKITRIKK
jgi:phage regulator Rha-like protein